MNQSHDGDEASAWLERVVCGELAVDDPSVQARFAREPALETRFVELRRIALALDDPGEEVLKDARTAADPSDRERVAAFLRPRFSDRTRPRWRPQRWLVAALVLMTLTTGVFWMVNRPSTADVYMHGGTGKLVSPSGLGQDFSEFRWEDKQGPGVWYEVIVSSDGRELARSVRLEETSWKPRPDIEAQWPEHIRWEVVRGSGNTPGALVGEAEAWRKR